jgi:hypothetical protein
MPLKNEEHDSYLTKTVRSLGHLFLVAVDDNRVLENNEVTAPKIKLIEITESKKSRDTELRSLGRSPRFSVP